MDIANKKEVDDFLWEHRDNGCDGVKGDLLDDDGLPLNIAWQDKATGESIEIKYQCSHGKGIADYCLECGRVNGG